MPSPGSDQPAPSTPAAGPIPGGARCPGRHAVVVTDAVDTPAEPVEKRVSWAELFFDLVFVFAVTEVSTLLEADHSWAGALRALVVFVPIYWAWVGVAIQTNVRDMSTPALRIGMFAVALAGLFMALAVPDAYGDRALLFALSYWAARLVLGFALFSREGWRINPYTSAWPSRARSWSSARSPTDGPGSPSGDWPRSSTCPRRRVLRRRLRGMHFDAPHLAERFGLFVLIALGESVVAIGSSAAPAGRLGLAVGFAVAAAFTVSAGLWWVYFNYAADAVRHALATAQVQLDVTRLVLSYGHLSLIAAIIAVGVGLREAVAHPGTALPPGGVGLLFGGTALYLTTFGYTRWTMFHLVSTTRLTAAGVVVLLIVPAAHLPATAALLLLAAVLIALNTVEYLRVDSIGWRARLARRARIERVERVGRSRSPDLRSGHDGGRDGQGGVVEVQGQEGRGLERVRGAERGPVEVGPHDQVPKPGRAGERLQLVDPARARTAGCGPHRSRRWRPGSARSPSGTCRDGARSTGGPTPARPPRPSVFPRIDSSQARPRSASASQHGSPMWQPRARACSRFSTAAPWSPSSSCSSASWVSG